MFFVPGLKQVEADWYLCGVSGRHGLMPGALVASTLQIRQVTQKQLGGDFYPHPIF